MYCDCRACRRGRIAYIYIMDSESNHCPEDWANASDVKHLLDQILGNPLADHAEQVIIHLKHKLLDAHVAGIVHVPSSARVRSPAAQMPSSMAALLSIPSFITCWVALPQGFDPPRGHTTETPLVAVRQAGQLPPAPRTSFISASPMQSQSRRRETTRTSYVYERLSSIPPNTPTSNWYRLLASPP